MWPFDSKDVREFKQSLIKLKAEVGLVKNRLDDFRYYVDKPTRHNVFHTPHPIAYITKALEMVEAMIKTAHKKKGSALTKEVKDKYELIIINLNKLTSILVNIEKLGPSISWGGGWDRSEVPVATSEVRGLRETVESAYKAVDEFIALEP